MGAQDRGERIVLAAVVDEQYLPGGGGAGIGEQAVEDRPDPRHERIDRVLLVLDRGDQRQDRARAHANTQRRLSAKMISGVTPSTSG